MKRVARFEKISFAQFEKDFSISGKNVNDVYDEVKIPKRATRYSAGYDFYAPFDFSLKPGETIKIPTGIRCKLKPSWVLQIFPRSSLGSKFRLQIDNTVGIIDADYYFSDNEGHIFVKITNSSNDGKTLEVLKGQGFVQGIFLQYGITFDDKCRNIRNGGFGSTTK